MAEKDHTEELITRVRVWQDSLAIEDLVAETLRLRKAIEKHRQGNNNMSLSNLELWTVLDD